MTPEISSILLGKSMENARRLNAEMNGCEAKAADAAASRAAEAARQAKVKKAEAKKKAADDASTLSKPNSFSKRE